MSGKLIFNQLKSKKDNILNQEFLKLYNIAADNYVLETGKKRTKFPRALKIYVSNKTNKNLDIAFSNKDVKRILYPLRKKEHTKHTIEIVYYLLDYLVSKDLLLEEYNNVQVITLIQETFDIISRMNDVLKAQQSEDSILKLNGEDLIPLDWQKDRIQYFMNSSSEYEVFNRK